MFQTDMHADFLLFCIFWLYANDLLRDQCGSFQLHQTAVWRWSCCCLSEQFSFESTGPRWLSQHPVRVWLTSPLTQDRSSHSGSDEAIIGLFNKIKQPSLPVSATNVGAASPSTSVTRGLTYYKAFNFSTGLQGDVLPFHCVTRSGQMGWEGFKKSSVKELSWPQLVSFSPLSLKCSLAYDDGKSLQHNLQTV